MSLPQPIDASASPEVQQNDNAQSTKWAYCFGNDPRGNSGLVRRYSGGRWGGFDVVDTDLTFTGSTTNYVVAALADGTITKATSTTNWNDGDNYKRIEKVVTGASSIDPDDVEDHRGGPGGVHGSGGGGGGGGGGGTRFDQAACSDLSTAILAGTSKAVWRKIGADTLSEVRASLGTAQASGSIFTVDVNKNGVTVLSTKLTIDNTEKTSLTAATAAVISATAGVADFADDDEISIDVDQVGNGTAKGLVVALIWA